MRRPIATGRLRPTVPRRAAVQQSGRGHSATNALTISYLNAQRVLSATQRNATQRNATQRNATQRYWLNAQPPPHPMVHRQRSRSPTLYRHVVKQ